MKTNEIKAVIEVLTQIVEDNYAEDLGTYDYDGIAELTLGTLEMLKEDVGNE